MITKTLIVIVAFTLPVVAQQKPAAGADAPRPQARTRLAGQRIPASVPILRVTHKPLNKEQAHERIQALIQALDLPVKGYASGQEMRESRRGLLRLRSGEHKFEVYPAAGGITYQSTKLYEIVPAAEGEAAPLDRALLERANQDLQKLAAAKLIDLGELDRKSVHISHQRTRSAERAEKGVRLGKLSTLDSRVDFTRQIGDLRVAGNGVRLIYGNDLRLYGCEIHWRPVQIPEQKTPLAVSRSEAVSIFRGSIDRYVRLGSRVELVQAELVFVDPGPRREIASLEPTYLFLYQVRSPIPGRKGEFIVGKKRLYSVPAVKPTAREKE